MVACDYQRQVDIFNPEDYYATIGIVGLGNIGSHTALTLARLGVKQLSIYDFDDVEIHNLTSQHYSVDDLGMKKARALYGQIRAVNPEIACLPFERKFEADMVPQILIVAVDSMAERKSIFAMLQKSKVKPEVVIDGRVGGAQLEIYTMTSLKAWSDTLVDQVSEDPCGGRYIAYVSVVIGGLITNQVKKILKKEAFDKSIMIHLDSLEIAKNYEL